MNEFGWVYDKIVESDTRFDNTSRSWVTTTTGCTGSRYDLLSVATHEMGHWVGLGHVAEVVLAGLDAGGTSELPDTGCWRTVWVPAGPWEPRAGGVRPREAKPQACPTRLAGNVKTGGERCP